MDPAPYRLYREAWLRRWREADKKQEERVQVARQASETCARLLVERYGARRVYLFGSLVGSRTIHDRSDIDLAVEGLGLGRAYWRALAELWASLPPGIELDLVPLEDADPGLVEHILTEGKLLYDDQGLHQPAR
jgi:predicted nucleotidyltransferase